MKNYIDDQLNARFTNVYKVINWSTTYKDALSITKCLIVTAIIFLNLGFLRNDEKVSKLSKLYLKFEISAIRYRR